jgi:hypothetical protein
MEDNMKATVVDLRYRMNEVIKALERRERVTITHHGKVKGIIEPTSAKKTMKVEEHPYFNSAADESKTVAEQMDELRVPRYNDV